MAKTTAIERAITKLENEVYVLQLAIAKLREQQTAKAARKPKAVKPAEPKQTA